MRCAALWSGSYLWTRTDDCPGRCGCWAGRPDSFGVSCTSWAAAASPPTLTPLRWAGVGCTSASSACLKRARFDFKSRQGSIHGANSLPNFRHRYLTTRCARFAPPMGYITPNWLPIAAVQLLAGKWKDRKLHAAAHEALADACRETLGWGVFPTRGLASLTGFKRSGDICTLWDKHLAGTKRDHLQFKLVPEYCRREGIFLNADETLLEYFGRCKDQEMVTVQADQVRGCCCGCCENPL